MRRTAKTMMSRPIEKTLKRASREVHGSLTFHAREMGNAMIIMSVMMSIAVLYRNETIERYTFRGVSQPPTMTLEIYPSKDISGHDLPTLKLVQDTGYVMTAPMYESPVMTAMIHQAI